MRSAGERQLEIVGEALSVAIERGGALVERLPELRRIVGLRNRLINGCDAVDDEIVWDIVQTKAPLLEAQRSRLLLEASETTASESTDSPG